MMTKKHFKALANAIKTADGDYNALVDLIMQLCAMENPRFDKERFVEACVGEQSPAHSKDLKGGSKKMRIKKCPICKGQRFKLHQYFGASTKLWCPECERRKISPK